MNHPPASSHAAIKECNGKSLWETILWAIPQAYTEMGIASQQIALLPGISFSKEHLNEKQRDILNTHHCFPHFHTAMFGQLPSIATGAAIADKELLYICIAEPADTTAGLGHFIYALQRKININYLSINTDTLHKNSPSTDLCSLAIEFGAGYVARGCAKEKTQLTSLLKGAFAHNGFSFIDIIPAALPSPQQEENKTETDKYTASRRFKEYQQRGALPAGGLVYRETNNSEEKSAVQSVNTPRGKQLFSKSDLLQQINEEMR